MLSRPLAVLVLSMLSLTVPACLSEEEAPATEGNEPQEELVVSQEGITTNCAASIDRRQLHGTISTSATGTLADQSGGVNTGTAYKKRCSTAFSMAVGDRHFVRVIGVNGSGSANPASINIERDVSGSWVKVKSKSTAGTSTEVLDWTVDVAGSYRACVIADDTTEGGSDYIRMTSDKSNPAYCGAAGSAVDYCFGASSANCNQCSTQSNGKMNCPVSVGSQMHDTCCAHNPLGDNCGGSACNPGTSGTNCGWVSNCALEDDHAWNDGYASRRWNKNFDPTEPYYRPLAPSDKSGDYADFYTTDYNKAKTTSWSMKAPAGQAMWDVDAVNGWCASGSYGSSTWSLQGNYRVCN